MDPISLIVAALISGASAAVQETAGDVIKDAYSGLRALVRRRFGGNEPQELDAPEDNKAWLEEQLKKVGADGDEELVRAAQEVMKQTDPEGVRAGIYNVTISGGKGIVVGAYANVTMNFEGD